MSDELRDCPFCGDGTEIMLDMCNRANARCSSAECFMHNRSWVDLSEWNTRPIEDALRIENAKLKARVEAAEGLIKEQDLFVALMSSAFDKDRPYSIEKFAAMSRKAIEKLEQARANWEDLK